MFPAFRPEWIVYEDDDLLVVNKPAHMASQAFAEGRSDDIVSRIHSYLRSERVSEREPYLGIHHRLDADTSGIMVFAKRPEANESLAKQFESRSIVKRYVAGVVGGPAAWMRGGEQALRHDLQKAQDGRMEVARGRGGGSAKPAVTHVQLRKREGARALLELRLETGRTHQARVQLEAARAPIVGCRLYGGAEFSRLLLHAESIELLHPRTKQKLALQAPLPATFHRWLETGLVDAPYDDVAALSLALQHACDRRYFLACDPSTTAFRLVNEEGDALPRLAVDVYGEHAVVQFYDGEMWTDPARVERVLDAVQALGFAGVYRKTRPAQANVIVETRTDKFAPKHAVRGGDAAEPLRVLENGVPYLTRLGDGLSTGLFLDQRHNRNLLGQAARGARVLNLFAYACGFTLAAAHGGAASTVSVDVSTKVMEEARKNMLALGMPIEQHRFVVEDVFRFLEREQKSERRYDLIILDPPSYSSTKSHRFSAESNYEALAALTLSVLAPGGRLLACTNHRKIYLGRFRKFLRNAAQLQKVEIDQLKDLKTPEEFPALGESHLKSVLLTAMGPGKRAGAVRSPRPQDHGGGHNVRGSSVGRGGARRDGEKKR
jgi:23S rRNA (cytosine1962-C5)-methyltransferase